MSDAPEANAQAVELQPITVDRFGLFWFSFFWFWMCYRQGKEARKRIFHQFRLSKHFMEILGRYPATAQRARSLNLKTFLFLSGSSLLGLPIGILLGIELGYSSRKHVSLIANFAEMHPQGTAVAAISLLVVLGAGQLLWIDLYRDLHRLVDRYNAYVEEQTKAKAMPDAPAPPATS